MMRVLISEWIDQMGVHEGYNDLLSSMLLLVVIGLIGLVAYLIARRVLNLYSHKIADKTATTIDDMLIEKGVFRMLARIAPALTIYMMLPMLGEGATVVEELIISLIIIFVTIAVYRVLDALVDSVKGRSKTKAGPMKGISQVIKIGIGVVAGLLIIVTFMGNEKGWAIFSSIGGLSAVLLLIFRDSILGFVAGIQLSTDNLLKLGDWLEMPKYNADGEVVDISLTKITVRNWDKTYTAIPAYRFLEESFKNWEGMTESGGRRIKRSINVDMNTVGFLTEEEIEKLRRIDILKAYLAGKFVELDEFNTNVSGDHLANRRQLTNIGTFRAYIREYLKHHPKVHNDMTLIARQLQPTEKGMPIEIYCFTNVTAWADYEGIQSDIFDHLLAIMPEFGLRPYQQISGYDLVAYR